jgi:two-component system sensor kinase FixL
VCVTDTGSGIPENRLTTIFEPFVTTKPGGMGMGLPISRTIVEAHGGRLWAERNGGHGMTFRFTVPLHATVPS